MFWRRSGCGRGAPISGRPFFISNGEPVPIWDLVNRILAAGGLPPVTKTVPLRVALAAGWLLEKVYGILWPFDEPPMTRFLARELATAHWFDITAARRDLGYEPRVSLEEGLRRLAVWLRERDERVTAATAPVPRPARE